MPKDNHVDVIVFEYLETKGKDIREKETEAAFVEKTGYSEAMRTSGTQDMECGYPGVCAWNTSRLAYDGTGDS